MVSNEYIINDRTTDKYTPESFFRMFDGTQTFCLFDNEILKDAPDCPYENTYWVLFDTGFINLENMLFSARRDTYIKVQYIYVYDTPSGVEMYDSMGQHVCGNKRYLLFKYYNTRTKREMIKRIVSYNHRYFKKITQIK